MPVLVASSSTLSARAIVEALGAEGIQGFPWEVGTQAPRPEGGRWETVVLDLRAPWGVPARFLPAGPRIAILSSGDEKAMEISRQRGARRTLNETQLHDLAESVRDAAGKANGNGPLLPGIFVQAEIPFALIHPLHGIEETNPRFCRWLDAEEGEIPGLDLASFFGPEEAHSLAGLFLDLLSGERESEWREIAIRLPGKKEKTSEAGFSAVFRDDLGQARILMTVKDGGKTRQTEERLAAQSRKLAVMQSINLSLNAALDSGTALKTLVSLLLSHADVDAAAVFLLDGGTMKLEFAEGEGFLGQTIRSRSLSSGQGLAGRAALRREPVFVPDLDSPGEILPDPFLLKEEGFRSSCAAPLLAMNRVLGVVQIFCRKTPENLADWQEMLTSVARQASVALHRTFLVNELERANLELNLAYDSTIEGWSKALDLKCREPEGHTEKVTEMAILLARRVGVKEKDLQPIRRGAILHDIGKMGIPDAILTKPGPLTEEEWKTMRLHPVYALQMLQPIDFLRDALAIPYSHHEHWDGQGYPLGLKGEQIPLAARIFSVVDVWNSLMNDQPYRRAWKADRVRTYIRENAGRLFDPEITEAFLELIEEPSYGRE